MCTGRAGVGNAACGLVERLVGRTGGGAATATLVWLTGELEERVNVGAGLALGTGPAGNTFWERGAPPEGDTPAGVSSGTSARNVDSGSRVWPTGSAWSAGSPCSPEPRGGPSPVNASARW